MQADHDINMQKAEDGVHASAGHARTKEQREARSKRRKELKEKKEEKEEKEEEEEAKAYEKMGDINVREETAPLSWPTHTAHCRAAALTPPACSAQRLHHG